jgi:hypothetical protein
MVVDVCGDGTEKLNPFDVTVVADPNPAAAPASA